MYPSQFDYRAPNSVQEAVELLSQNDGAKLLAGGHSLIPMMTMRLAQPTMLIDIGRIAGLQGITEDGDTLIIGAMTTHAQVASSDVLQARCPIVAEAAGQIGDQQVRNRGTIGGSLAHADPAADLPTVMLALNASLKAVGPGGERTIASNEFFIDMLTTALEPDEVLTEIHVPVLASGSGSAYVKYEQPASRYAILGAAAIVTVEGGKCSECSIAVGGATPAPVRASAAEDVLRAQALNDENIHNAAARVPDAITDPMGDIHASGEYRRRVSAVYAERALRRAAERAG